MRISIDSIDESKRLSVLTLTEETGENHRETLCPGQFERARAILPDDLYQTVCEMWSNEVIEAYNAKAAEQWAELGDMFKIAEPDD